MNKKSLIPILAFFLASCSAYKPTTEKDEINTVDFTETLDQKTADQISVSESSPEDEGDVLEFSSEQIEEISESINNENLEYRADSIMDDSDAIVAENDSIKRDIASVIDEEVKFEDYTVQDGETLMVLAFRKYRDIDMWKNIVSWNDGISKINPGDVIRLKVVDPETLEYWEPNGSPYLVQKDDYLGKIAMNVYEGHGSYWRSIWKNNKLMIKDPDLIFPGFTLYYLDIETAKAETLQMKRQEYLAWKEAKKNNELAKREIASEIEE